MRQQWAIIFVAIMAMATVAAGQDELKAGGVPHRNIRITGMEDCAIVYEQAGRENTKPLAEVNFLQIDGEDEFNEAENLLAAGEYEDALKKFRLARREAVDEWIQDLAELRRLQTMDQAGLIDQAVTLWLTVLTARYSSANALALVPKNLDLADDRAFDKAFDALEEQREETGTATDVKRVAWLAMMDLQLAIARLKGDGSDDAQRLAKEMLAVLNALAPADIIGVSGRLEVASVFVSDPQSAAAVKEIVTGDLYEYPDEQLPQALLLLGKAQLALAETGDEDKSLLTDAGNNLMHVVVFFGESEQAAEAYFLAAGVNRQLGNDKAARGAYQMIIDEYADSPFAAQAAEALEAKVDDESATDQQG